NPSGAGLGTRVADDEQVGAGDDLIPGAERPVNRRVRRARGHHVVHGSGNQAVVLTRIVTRPGCAGGEAAEVLVDECGVTKSVAAEAPGFRDRPAFCGFWGRVRSGFPHPLAVRTAGPRTTAGGPRWNSL